MYTSSTLPQPFWLTLAAISRLYSVPYLILVGFCALLSAQQPLTATATILVLLLPLTLTVGLAALNDSAHARADLRAGRTRPYPPYLLLSLGLVGTLSTLLLASLSGVGVLAGLGGSVVLGFVYALIKRYPLLGNIFRGTTTVSIVLGLASLTAITPLGISIALGAGLLDASGNIWGDVRDQKVDVRSETRTIAVTNPLLARMIAVLLHISAVAVLIPLGSFLAWTLVGSLMTYLAPPARSHLIFLLTKYATFLIVGVGLVQTPLAWAVLGLLALCALGVGSLYTTIHRPINTGAQA
jgi:hypothetical protein